MDNGIINAVIGNFNPIEKRTDIGALWENFIISERVKMLNIMREDTKFHFWRSVQQQEIDLIEIRENAQFAYEIKWNSRAKAKFSLTYVNAYKPKETKAINAENYDDFLLEK